MGETETRLGRCCLDTVRRTGDRATLLRRSAIATLLGAAMLALVAYLVRLSSTVSIDSADLAGLLLSGEDMARGNWLLHGWILGSDSLWLTDGPVYAAGVALRGLDPVLLRVIPAVMSVVLVGAAAAAATAGRKGPVIAFAAVLSVLPIVFPSSTMVEVLTGPFHTGATIVALVSAVALYHAQERVDRASQRWAIIGFVFVLLTAGTLSDPYTVVLALAPIALVSAARTLLVRPPEERWRHVLPVLVVTAAWYGASAALWWVRYLGGATIIPFLPSTLPYARLGEGVSNLVLALLQLGGGDVFGRLIDRSLVSTVLRLGYLAAGFAATWLVLRNAGRDLAGNRVHSDWLTAVLATSVAVALVGNVLGTADVNARYRFPLLVMASVVLARQFGVLSSSWIARRTVPAAAGALVVLAVYIGPWGRYVNPVVPERPDPYVTLGHALESLGLDYGYGGYWEASNVTVETRGAVTIRPVVSTKVYQPGFGPSGFPPAGWRLTRIMVSSKDTWYSNPPARFFVVVDNASQWDRDTGVTLAVATKTYGRPHQVYHIDRFTVLVWDRGPRVSGPAGRPSAATAPSPADPRCWAPRSQAAPVRANRTGPPDGRRSTRR